MIHCIVTENGVPTITLQIDKQDWQATIDTGFNGYLELPEVLQNSLNTRYVGKVTSALAGGQMIEEDVYLINFPFDGSIIQSEVTLLIGLVRATFDGLSTHIMEFPLMFTIKKLN